MKHLTIEWQHYDKKGNTCVRCSNTGIAVQQTIEELRNSLRKKKIEVVFKETKLSADQIQASNSILLNGVLLEDILPETKAVETSCSSCCKLVGSDISCRALDCRGQFTEDISASLIKQAVDLLLRKEEL